MSALTWDAIGARVYETGVDHGVLYIPDTAGVYGTAYAWNGLTTVTESPTGAEATPQYADNIQYLNLISAEKFGATIEAFTYPDAFAQCDGTAQPEVGLSVGQQDRHPFGLAYRTIVGNDTDGNAHGVKLHLLYGLTAAPSEKAYATVNDSPEAIKFSWQVSAIPVPVTGYKPTALLVIDSTKVDPTAFAALQAIVFGSVGADARLPLPDEVLGMFAGTLTLATPSVPTFASNTITIPTVTGVEYRNAADNSVLAAGAHVITVNTIVKAYPKPGYYFPALVDNDWLYTYT